MSGDFSITRSVAAPLLTLFSVVLTSDLVFMGTVFVFGVINHGFAINATLTTLYWLLFLFKIFLVLFVVFSIVRREAGAVYYVQNRRLYLRRASTLTAAENYSTDLIRSVKVQRSFFGKRFNYGTLSILFADSQPGEVLTLKNVENPILVADLLQPTASPSQ